MTMHDRFLDEGKQWIDFLDEILVVCPKCRQMALVTPVPGAPPSPSSPRRLTCHTCGLQKITKTDSVSVRDEPIDGYFNQHLWLVAGVGHKILWAYNLKHLATIESFVKAHLRERQKNDAGYANRSLMSRLPPWIKKATNRDLVLKLVAQLKKKTQSGTHDSTI